MRKVVVTLVLVFWGYVLCADWYNPGVVYFKLVTNKTGINKVSMEDLFDLGFDLMGRDTAGINLLYRGEKIPYYFANGELIYCVPSVDVLDEYSNDFVVYFYYDADNLADKKIFEEAVFASDTLDYLEQNLNLKLHKRYFIGFDIYDYGYSRFKGWYWKILSDYPSFTGNQSLERAALDVNNLYLFPQKNSPIAITSYLATPMLETQSDFFNAKRKVTSYLNDDSISYVAFDSLIDNLAFESKATGKFAGLNELRLLNNTADNFDIFIEVGVRNIDITGYFKPYFYIADSYQSNALDVNSIKNNSLITINGLADSKLYLHDKISNSFLVKENNPVTHIAVNTRYETSTQSFLTTILVNDKNYKSGVAGIHIAVLSPNSNEIEERYSFSYTATLLTFLQELEDSSIVCIAMNGLYDINNNLKNYLAEFGLTQIMDYNGGDAYVCAFKKGTNLFVEELNKETKICSKDFSFYDAEKRWFAAEINLIGSNEGINYSLIFSDSSNVNRGVASKVNFTNLKDTSLEAELIIIYHNEFEEKSMEYADYRRSRGVAVKCVDADDVYKEFGFGNKSPYAIKDFLRYAYYNWKEQPKYVLFIGDASIDPRLCDSTSVTIDYIPTFGYPASDYWFGIFSNIETHNSELVVGRIPVANNTQLENYIEKVKIYESDDFQKWNKNFMFINGGDPGVAGQINSIEQNALFTATMLSNNPLCADTTIFRKSVLDSAITHIYKDDIIRALNSGAAMTIFHGHGSTIGIDNWGWQVDNLNNINRYGILVTLSCNTGEFASSSSQSLVNESFILSYRDKGFVAALGATTNITVSANRIFQYYLAEALGFGYRRIGDMVKYAKSKLEYNSSYPETVKSMIVMEYNFGILGDPMIEIKIDTLPDIYALSGEIIVTNEYGNTNITDDNTELTIKIPIHNAGINYNNIYTVKLESGGEEYEASVYGACETQEIEFTIPLDFNQNEIKIFITLDSENEIIESNKENNVVEKTIRILSKGLYPIEPLPNVIMNKNDLHFRFMKWHSVYNERYEFYLLDDNDNIIGQSNSDEIYFNNEYVDWIVGANNHFSLQENINYFINVKQYSLDSLFSQTTIPFTVADAMSDCSNCAELLFISSNTGLDTSHFLRGDTAFFKIDLANISLRTAIENIVVSIDEIGYSNEIKRLEPDENNLFTIPILTNNLYSGLNFLTANIAANDLYDFNNSYTISIYVYEDTEPPTLEIYIDKDLLSTPTANISAEPYIKVIMFDNSYLPVLIDNPISVRLNGVPLSEQNTQHYKLDVINEGKLKATLEFKPELLKERENLFRFIGYDATGNNIDVTYRFFVVQNNHLLLTFPYPNPAISSDVNIEFQLVRSEIGGTAKANIYDSEGKHIKEISTEINSSKGVIVWKRDDKNGIKVAPGHYTYIIEIIGSNWMEPFFGKIMLWK